MRLRLPRRLLPLAGLIAFIGSGALPCHGGPSPVAAQASQPPLEVHITLREWSLLPEQINVPVGRTVRFLAQHAGCLPHALPVEGNGILAESAVAGAGETVRLDVLFSVAGTYDMYCPVGAGDHRLLGQEGELRALGGISSLGLPATGAPEVDPAAPQTDLPFPE